MSTVSAVTIMDDKDDPTAHELSRMYQVLSLACCPLLLMTPQPLKAPKETEPLLAKPQPSEMKQDDKSLT